MYTIYLNYDKIFYDKSGEVLMTYFAYIKNSEDTSEIKIQEDRIKAYIVNQDIKITKNYKSNDSECKKIDKYFANKILNNLDYANGLIVSTLSSLGNSAHKILERVLQIKDKKITLHIAESNFILPSDNEDLYKFITAVISADKSIKDKRVELAKMTREKNENKIGRKAGKRTKSKFDKHKREIFKLYKLEVPITKILEKIIEKDDNLKEATAQGLGQYIKRIETSKEKKAQSDKERKEQLKQEKAMKLDEALFGKYNN